MIRSLKDWHQTKLGLLSFAIVEAAIMYGLLSLSINDGQLLMYLLTLIFLICTIQNLAKLIGKLIHGNSHKPAKAR